jgi:hypothetical protein
MFHYCSFLEDGCFCSLPPWVFDPKSAAFGCNKSTNEDEQGRLSTMDAPPIRGSGFMRGNSSFIVVVRLYSHGIVLVRLQS